ncbi:MAG: YfiR family protein, partial [Oceanococcaceae bacterium]
MLLVCALCTAPPALAAELLTRIKAAFLFNVAKFVEWPDPGPSLDICVLSDADFTHTAARELAEKSIGNSPLIVREIEPAQTRNCAMVYFGADLEPQAIAETLRHIQGQAVLSVGDSPELMELGGIMRLRQENGKLRFQVAMAPLEASGLRFSSKLLRLADVFPDGT